LRNIEIHPPKFPILNHSTIRPLKREEIKDFLSREIGQPVYWDRCVERLIQEGVIQFIEVGQEATLTKLIRWSYRKAEAFSAGEHFYLPHHHSEPVSESTDKESETLLQGMSAERETDEVS
jgi:malonyl CoA-acyl carrier protein transacylase